MTIQLTVETLSALAPIPLPPQMFPCITSLLSFHVMLQVLNGVVLLCMTCDIWCRLDYEVAELTWENGQLAMHGLGPPRVPSKPEASTSPTKYTWEKPRASGTLESIVNQATSFPQRKPPFDSHSTDELAPWFNQQRAAAAASATMTMDALVPCSNRSEDRTTHVMDPVPGLGAVGKCVVDCSTRAGSCSGPVATQEEELLLTGKRARVARVPVAPEWSSRDQSVSGSATFERESQHMTRDTYDMEMGVGFTSTSMGSPENTSSAKHGTKATTADDHDSVCHSRPPVNKTVLCYILIFNACDLTFIY